MNTHASNADFSVSSLSLIFHHIKASTHRVNTNNTSLEHPKHPDEVIKLYSQSFSSDFVLTKILDHFPTAVRMRDGNGQYPIHIAVIKHAPKSVVQILLNAYPESSNVQDSSGKIPLYYALLTKQSADVIDLLLNLTPNKKLNKLHNFMRMMSGDISEKYKQIQFKLNVFISSTFTDTHLERDILISQILPLLRKLGIKHDIEVTFVDMRWGVLDDNTLDHMTWVACKREIDRCYNESEGLFFLSLQSDKYGYMPLPRTIPQDVLDNRLINTPQQTSEKSKPDVSHSSTHGNGRKLNAHNSTCSIGPLAPALSINELVSKWYQLDTNALPPVYILRKLSDINDKDYWNTVLPRLRDLLKDLPFEPYSTTTDDLVVNRSVSEWEVKYALALAPQDSSPQRCVWFHRSFDDGVNNEQDPKSEYSDVRNNKSSFMKLNNLKSFMESKLLPHNQIKEFFDIKIEEYFCTSDYSTSISQKHVTPYTTSLLSETNKDRCAELSILGEKYISDWRNSMSSLLFGELDKIMNLRRDWDKNGCGMNIAGSDLGEILHHSNWAYAKCEEYKGRSALLQSTLLYIQSSNRCDKFAVPEPFDGISFGIIGKSGTGKTSLMAKIAQSVYSDVNDRRVVIIRFCGTSGHSGDGLSLVKSICLQIQYIFGVCPPNDDVYEKYKSCVSHFHSLLHTYPVVLFIDSLDQLSNEHHERSYLTFLDGIKPHPQTRIIVSALPDELKYCYGCETRLKTGNVHCIEVPELQTVFGKDTTTTAGSKNRQLPQEAMEILMEILAQQCRTLTSSQYDYVYRTLQHAGNECTALYVKLLSRVICDRNSLSNSILSVLKPTVEGLIIHIYESIEKEFGEKLVQTALAFITFSVQGVRDNEIEDLLSLSEDVMVAVNRYNTAKRLPSHVWLRVRAVIQDLICERDQGCLKWYHRQLQEVAEMRYGTLCDKKEIHALMARYFGDLLGEAAEIKSVVGQPLVLNGRLAWYDDAFINSRRCFEATTHLFEAEMFSELLDELCTIENICASAKCGVFFKNLEIFTKLIMTLAATPTLISEETLQRAQHYFRWLCHDAYSITVPPIATHIALTCTGQPLISIARSDLMKLFQSINENMIPIPISMAKAASNTWIRSIIFKNISNFDNVYSVLRDHSAAVNAVCYNGDGSKLISCSDDKTIRVWDSRTGARINVFYGHRREVTSIDISPDNMFIVSGSFDKTVRIWDFATGSVISTLKGHTREVLGVKYNYDGTKIVSVGYDNIYIWQDSKILLSCTGHTGGFLSVAFSPDGSQIAAGCWDNFVHFYNTSTGTQIRTLGGHSNWVLSISFSADGTKLVTSSKDCTSNIYELPTGNLLKKLEGHTDIVLSSDFSSDGNHIVSGSKDCTLCIWDVSTGSIMHSYLSQDGYWLRYVKYCPDGQKIATCLSDNSIRLWTPGGEAATTEQVASEKKIISCLAYCADGTRIACGEGKSVCIWDVRTGNLSISHEYHTMDVNELSFNSQGLKLLSCSNDKSIIVWNFQEESIDITLIGHKEAVMSIAYSSDDKFIVSGGEDKKIFIWNLEFGTGKPWRELTGHTGPVFSVRFSPSGFSIISGSKDKTVRLWKASSYEEGDWEERSVLHDHSDWVRSVRFSPNGSLMASAGDDNCICIYTVSGLLRYNIKTHTSCVNSIDFSFDSRFLASASDDKCVCVFDVDTGNQCQSFEVSIDSVSGVSFSPDGHQIAASTNDVIRIWAASRDRVSSS